MDSANNGIETSLHSCRLIVSGRVQGVGFRCWTKQRADELKLGGTVRNCPDGTVEVIVVGLLRSVNLFKQQLFSGPPLAQVTKIEAAPLVANLEDPKLFVISG